jgi:hypothetical protein
MDEHGNGDISNTHGETFKKYLLSLGINDRKISEKKKVTKTTKVVKDIL